LFFIFWWYYAFLAAGCCFDSAASQFPSVFTRRTEMLGI
jgi:hypothetical protein